MAYILSAGVSIPKYHIRQEEAEQLVKEIFPRTDREMGRLLPAFKNSDIKERQFVVPVDWFRDNHEFFERNAIYEQEAVPHAVTAINNCLKNEQLLSDVVHPGEIDCIIFASSTGIATPSVDARCMNELPFRSDTVRLPIWGMGCVAGASGLSRAFEWLKANPDKSALVICLEFCSLAFQKDDHRKSNFIGTVLFGDGAASVLLAGEQSPLRTRMRKTSIPKIVSASSRLKKQALDVMGWDVKEKGFHVIFAKSIPQLVETFWKKHFQDFLQILNIQADSLSYFIAHPGGMKVLQAYEKLLPDAGVKLKYSRKILHQHGNMSSPTVLYVLKSVMEEEELAGETSILTALGPGFSSELLALEWVSG
ncbi:MAG: type III polyketide synthase [Bacillaceae bacterium]|nr:type III polyketide synthase [Bacillaceae bacterium]